MNTESFIRPTLFLSISITIIGSMFKIMHWPYATLIMAFGMILMLFFIISAIYEVMNSSKIDGSEKFMWVIGFLFFGIITGLIYLLSARKRIV